MVRASLKRHICLKHSHSKMFSLQNIFQKNIFRTSQIYTTCVWMIIHTYTVSVVSWARGVFRNGCTNSCLMVMSWFFCGTWSSAATGRFEVARLRNTLNFSMLVQQKYCLHSIISMGLDPVFCTLTLFFLLLYITV